MRSAQGLEIKIILNVHDHTSILYELGVVRSTLWLVFFTESWEFETYIVDCYYRKLPQNRMVSIHVINITQ